uniref:GPI ethanolamine phosphate transferase 1 n=3 Tax=Lygus hesperus TaxID=30085 RepID=A0A0A9YEY2_LYGHE
MMYQQNSGYKVPTAPRKVESSSVAPLIACILGAPTPSNSIGPLPVNFLGMTDREIAVCQFDVVASVKTLYYQQAQQVLKGGWANLAVFDRREISRRKLEEMAQRMKLALQAGDYNAVGTISEMLVKHCQGNVHYYRSKRFLILSNITLFMLIGCLLCSLTLICPAFSGTDDMDNTSDWLRLPSIKPVPTIDGIFFIGFSVLISTVGISSFPARYQIYVTATVIPWWLAMRNARNWMTLFHAVCNQLGNARRNMMDFVYFMLILLTGSSTANKIPVICVYLVSMTFLSISELVSTSKSKIILWMITAVPMVAFSSYNYPENLVNQINTLAMFLLVVVSWIFTTGNKNIDRTYNLIVISNTLVAAMIVFGEENLVHRFAWLALGFVPFVGSTNLMTRFIQIFMSLGVPFFLMTSSGEPLVLIVFGVHAFTWMFAESYDQLSDFTVQTIPAERGSNGRRYSPMDTRMNYFYNLYAMLAGAMVHPDEYNEECSQTTAFDGLLKREFKMAPPVLCLTVMHVLMIRVHGGQRYYSLLLSFFYFTYIAFFSFLDVYKSSWDEDMESSHELNLVREPLSVWFVVLACSCSRLPLVPSCLQ